MHALRRMQRRLAELRAALLLQAHASLLPAAPGREG